MNKLRDIDDRSGLLASLLPSEHPSHQYVAKALLDLDYCYLVSLDQSEAANLLLNGSNDFGRFPTLEEVIKLIKQHPTYFEEVERQGGLYTAQVQAYYEQFKQGFELKDCFIRDKFDWMREASAYYIIDGMHRLVAYGLWSGLNPRFFPINLYLCTQTAF